MPGTVSPPLAAAVSWRYRHPAARSIPCRATFNSNGLITPPCGVPSSVGANRLFSITPAFNHCPDQCPGREVAEFGEQPVMIDLVERRRQVRVQQPFPLDSSSCSAWGIDRRDRIVAAAARPKPIGFRFEPRFRCGSRALPDPRLMAAVRDHWNTERALFPFLSGCARRTGSDREGQASGGSVSPARPCPRGQGDPPSIPAVARPALRSVTCRTLSSAFDRLRNINFCRLRTVSGPPPAMP